MRKRRNVAWLLVLVVGMMLVPAIEASAFTKAEKKHEKKQNAAIGKASKAAARALNRTAALTTTVGQQTKSLADLQTLATGIDNRLKFIEGAAPTIIAGLTELKANLEKLGALVQAVEYGRAGIFASGATVRAGGAVTSADIPDDGNAITTGEDAIVTSDAAGAVTIDLRAAIRSNESDGDTAAETAGQAGGYLYVTNLDTGVRVACTGAPNPPGIFGTQAGDSIVTPSGTVTNLPLKNIPGGVLRTDTSKPDATSTNLLPGPCGFGAAGAGITYMVHYSVNFVDIPTSSAPGPTE
jgi:hypothetical protein